MSEGAIHQTGAASSTPSIASAATALASNPARRHWCIQNLGTNPLFVRLATGASATVFDFVLKAGVANDDGLGGVATSGEGLVYTGIITIAGTSPRYTSAEIAP